MPVHLVHRSIQLVKQGTTVVTLMAMVSMSYSSTILTESLGIRQHSFRFGLLVCIALRIFGVGVQLALWTVLLKWTLVGVCACVQECFPPPRMELQICPYKLWGIVCSVCPEFLCGTIL